MTRRCVFVLMLVLAAAIVNAQDRSIGQFKAKADAGDVSAQLHLAHKYEKGDGTAANEGLAFKWYMAAAEQGNADAQFAVGLMYRLGTGTEQDKVKAVEWYRKAARQGHAEARFNLGVAYYNGDGVPISDERSFAWFLLAEKVGEVRAKEAVDRAKSEHSEQWQNLALAKLAEMLEKGDEVAAEPSAAAEIYQKVLSVTLSPMARQTAHYQLAQMYLDGRGVEKDVNAARSHMVAAAQEKAPGAVQKLGEMYESGVFGAPDLKEAARWYGEGVHYGEYFCMYRLGRLYEAGTGVKLDRAEAFYLYVVASRQDYKDAKAAAELLFPQLTDKEFKTAQKKLSERGITVKKKALASQSK